MSPKADKIVPYFGKLFVDEPLPKNGFIILDPKKTGFGVTLNKELKLRRPYTHETMTLQNRLSKAASAYHHQHNWLKFAGKLMSFSASKVTNTLFEKV